MLLMGVIRKFGGFVIKDMIGKQLLIKELSHREVVVLIVQERRLLTMTFGSNITSLTHQMKFGFNCPLGLYLVQIDTEYCYDS